MARDFAQLISKGTGHSQRTGDVVGKDVLNQVFNFAETVVDTIGINFTPTPQETERIIEMKYDKEQEKRTRLFTFDNTIRIWTPGNVSHTSHKSHHMSQVTSHIMQSAGHILRGVDSSHVLAVMLYGYLFGSFQATATLQNNP